MGGAAPSRGVGAGAPTGNPAGRSLCSAYLRTNVVLEWLLNRARSGQWSSLGPERPFSPHKTTCTCNEDAGRSRCWTRDAGVWGAAPAPSHPGGPARGDEGPGQARPARAGSRLSPPGRPRPLTLTGAPATPPLLGGSPGACGRGARRGGRGAMDTRSQTGRARPDQGILHRNVQFRRSIIYR